MRRIFFLFTFMLCGFVISCRQNSDFKEEIRFWRVFSDNQESCSYILGTVHILPDAFIDSIPGLPGALDDVDVFMMECSSKNDINSPIVEATLPKGVEYESLFKNKDDYNYFIDFLADHHMMNFHFRRFSPAYISMLLTQETLHAALPENFCGIEAGLEALAIKKGKQVNYFESGSEQLALFQSYLTDGGRMSFNEQTDSLLAIMKSFDKDKREALEIRQSLSGSVRINDYYAIGKDETITDRMYDYLISRRNKEWMKTILSYMKDHRCLLAVGDGHLRGKDGLLNLLKNKGYIIEPCQ